MLEAISIFSLCGALVVLGILCLIDLKVRLLPNEWVLALACTGVVFHLATLFAFASFRDMWVGAFIGGASLYLIRGIANVMMKEDAMGLGDVKLMAAAGLWLGPYYILVALGVGALAGVVHGLGIALLAWKRTGRFPNLSLLNLPAGPGFVAGIIVAGCLLLKDFSPAISLPFLSL